MLYFLLLIPPEINRFWISLSNKTVIYFARLILNEWTIEQMAFRYLNFKSTAGRESLEFMENWANDSWSELSRPMLIVCAAWFHHLRWVNDINNYDSASLSNTCTGPSRSTSRLYSLFTIIILRADNGSGIRGRSVTFCWCLTRGTQKLVSFPWNTKIGLSTDYR